MTKEQAHYKTTIDTEIRTTIYNMVGVLMADDFKEWMEENWYIIKDLDEFNKIMDLYIHGTNSGYYFEK